MATSPFLAACRGEPHDTVPVWFMRQAGRSLPEYREVRAQHSFVEVVHQPELTAEVTLQPVRRYGVDAAILFSDIVTPLQAVGVPVELTSGVGPTLANPVRRREDIDVVRVMEPDVDAPYVYEAIRLITRELGERTPLIGFAGAPFTLASYLVEGRPSRDWVHTKALMYGDEATWHDLLGRLADLVLAHLRAQVEAGASAVQLFDSWVGALSRADYLRYVQPHSRRIFEGLADLGVPRIHFGVNTGELLHDMADAGADVVGVDWRIPLDEARRRLPEHVGTQGNLDPTVCLGPVDFVERRVDEVLAASAHRPDHVFNLGHGVLPELDPGVLAHVVDHVHEHGRTDGPVRTEAGTTA